MRKMLNTALGILCSILLSVMVLIVLWQVFARSVLNNPNTATEELVRFGLVWLAMLASAYVVGERTHLAVTVLSEKLRGKAKTRLDIIVQLLFILFAVIIMIYGGFNAVGVTMDQISPSLSIPMGYVYLAVPVSGVLIVCYSVLNLLDDMKKSKEAV